MICLCLEEPEHGPSTQFTFLAVNPARSFPGVLVHVIMSLLAKGNVHDIELPSP